MAKVRKIKLEPLTAEAFRPFGWVMSVTDRPPDETVDGGLKDRWWIDFHTAGSVNVALIRVHYQGLAVSKLERHLNVTQAFVPLPGPPAMVVVAPPTDPDDQEAVPTPDQVRAFLVDGSKGYVFAKGTWHSLNWFPLYPGQSTFVVLTDHETYADLRLGYAGKGGFQLTQEVDYPARFGVTFETVL